MGTDKYLSFLGNDSSSKIAFKKSLFNAIEISGVKPNPIINTSFLDVNITYEDKFSLSLYNKRGQKIKTFFYAKTLNQGRQSLELNMIDVPFGNYFLKLSSENSQKTIKIIKI